MDKPLVAGELEVVGIVAAVVTSAASLGVAILTYLLNRRQARDLEGQIQASQEQTALYAKRLEIAEKQLETNKANLKLVEKGVAAMMAIAESQKKQAAWGAQALEKAITALERRLSEGELRTTRDAIVREREIALREQRALAEKQKTNWSILAGVAKALGWAYDRGLLSGDEDDNGDDED